MAYRPTPARYLFLQKFYWNMATLTLIYLHIIYAAFCYNAELSCCDRDHKAENIHFLAL